TANFARLQESARSLEEFSKIVEPQLAKEWERVRYESYTLEKIAYEEAAKLERDEASEKPTPSESAENEPIKEEPEKDEPTEKTEPDPQATRPDVPEPAVEETPRKPVTQGAPFARVDELSPRELRKAKLRKSNFCFYVDRPFADADAETLFNSEIGIFQICYYPDDATSSPESILFLEQFSAAYANETNALRRPLLLTRDFNVWADDFDGGVVTDDNWREARAGLGNDRLLGAAVSTLDEALGAFQAGEEGILDFIEAGPIFSADGVSASTGLGWLRAVLEAVDEKPPIPVFAFGGIAESNADELCYAGIEHVCADASVISEQDRRLGRIAFASMY
ncbi:MAG: thiamine phosphate synthase, partial [Thermoguttaceae bacterium]|nr:thiamine phosphate synthase [Thermoguttaceae bacterium]